MMIRIKQRCLYIRCHMRPSARFVSSGKMSNLRRNGSCFGAPESMVLDIGSRINEACGPRCLPSYTSNSTVFFCALKVAIILNPIGGGPPTMAPTPSAPRYIAWPSNSSCPFRTAPSVAQTPTNSGGIWSAAKAALAQIASARLSEARVKGIGFTVAIAEFVSNRRISS